MRKNRESRARNKETRNAESKKNFKKLSKTAATMVDGVYIKKWNDYGDRARQKYFADNKPDCIFLIGTEKIRSFRWILSEVSLVFEAMFSGKYKETTMPEIELEDDLIYFKKFIHFVHHNELHYIVNPTLETLINLHIIADKYEVKDLMETCVSRIRGTSYRDITLYDDTEWINAFGFAHALPYNSENKRLKRYTTDAVRYRLYEPNQFIIRCTCVYDWESPVFYAYVDALCTLLRPSVLFNMIEIYAKVWRMERKKEDFTIDNKEEDEYEVEGLDEPEGTTEDEVEVEAEATDKVKVQTRANLEKYRSIDNSPEEQPASLEMLLRCVDFKDFSLREFRTGPGRSKLLYDWEKLEVYNLISKQIPRVEEKKDEENEEEKENENETETVENVLNLF